MKVLIVGRTKMSGSHRCIGGIGSDGSSVRLLPGGMAYWDTSAPFQIGQIWDMSYAPVANLVPPHTEDVSVSSHTFVTQIAGLATQLSANVAPWKGGISQLFSGLLGFTNNHNGYISHVRGVPSCSTGFWLSDQVLTLRADGKHYDYAPGTSLHGGLSYVGEAPPVSSLPAGTLLRVSLARWWRPDDADAMEYRCYLQLSGWF
jgi:hypothetical protein